MSQTLIAVFSDPQTWLFIAIGFFAQLCDGLLGMGFGVISSAVLASFGLPREVVSASVNGAKMFTGTSSAIAHIVFRNVDWRVLAMLTASGVLGGLAGATLLSRGAGAVIGPLVSVYLIIIGVYIIWRTSHIERLRRVSPVRIGVIGGAGGLLEAVSGVWGPLVTSNLVGSGVSPRYAVGSSNCAETVVAVFVFAVLVGHIGFEQLSQAVIGLLAGALVASPLAARLTISIPRQRLMIGVGVLVIATSAFRLLRDLGLVD